MDRQYSWVFGLVGFYFLYAGFPGSGGILSGLGLDILWRVCFLVGMCVITAQFTNEGLDFRSALGWSGMLWLLCAALSAGWPGCIHWLLVIPAVAFATWPGQPKPEGGWFASLPEPLHKGLVIILAVIGAGMISGGLNNFLIEYGGFDPTQVFIGTSLYIGAYAVLLIEMRKEVAKRVGILGYSGALATIFLAGLVELATAQVIRTDTLLGLGVLAMLAIQVQRHFRRSDGWLKLIETAIGGLISLAALATIVAWHNDNSPWAFVNFPEAALAWVFLGAGLVLIWSDRIFFADFWRRSRNGAAKEDA